ncbi:MAG: TssQ family T6SS-associated lipoprotein [Proteobacteria bacterium]|nr:TssQ family T6SS-associated lipoprotein [Pseudomonadota bacterium]
MSRSGCLGNAIARGWLLSLACVVTLSGCAGLRRSASAPGAPAASSASPPAAVSAASPPVVPAAATPAAAEPARPAGGEQALAQGITSYQSGRYPQAEGQLKQALKAGLGAPADVARAHKHLAFIYCTSRRQRQCAAAFKAARAADPRFALSKAEAGHPMWSRVYRKALGLK